jgi:hypothetical protein
LIAKHFFPGEQVQKVCVVMSGFSEDSVGDETPLIRGDGCHFEYGLVVSE